MKKIEAYRSKGRPPEKTQLDFGRISSLGQAQAVPVRMHDDVLYEMTQYKLPFTVDEFDAQFGSEIRLFTTTQPEQCPGRQISPLVLDAAGSELDDFFWLTGISLIAFGEPKSFTINGGLMARPVPPATTATPCYDGCTAEDGETPVEISQASLYWGGPGWQFLYNFLNAYRFKWLIRRYEYLNVSASALGITHMGPEFVGAGNSQVPAMPYIQQVNETMAEKEIPQIFIPQNTTSLDEPECIGAPTADAVYGAMRLNGSSGRPYCLTRPMLLAPGMHLKMSFERADGDCCYYAAMRRNSVMDPDNNGLADAQLTAGTCESASFQVPGGCFTLGVVLQGQVMDEEACWEALTSNVNFGVGSPSYELLKGNTRVAELLRKRMHGRGVSGVLAGVPEQHRPQVEQRIKGLLDAPAVEER